MIELDETIEDVRKLLDARGKKCLILYGDHGQAAPIRAKFSASVLDLNSMAATSILCVATELSQLYGYDKQKALELAVASVTDAARLLSTGAGISGG